MIGALAGAAHVNLSVNRAGFGRDMRAAERDFVRSADQIGRAANRSGVQVARGLGFALLGSIGPLFLFGKAVRSSYQELEQMRRENAQTNAVIESTGGVANVTAAHIERLSEAGLKLSGVDDQLVQRGANVLLTFTKIRNEVGEGNNIFDQAVSSVLDMAVALGDELQPTAIRVGRALQDPAYGINTLRRVGVNFTKEQQVLIQRLVETGDTLTAQKFILAELNREFGGSAQAAGEEFPAAIARAQEAAAGLGAEYLETLIPAIEDLAEWIEETAARFSENEEAQQEFRDTVVGVGEALVDVAEFANDVAEALGGWETTIKILIGLKIASIIMGWGRAMQFYAGQTKNAAFWTGALAIAQMGTGMGLPINPRTGAPIPPKGGPGGWGKWAGRFGKFGRFVPGVGAVAVGTAVVLSQTPGASGAKAGERRSQKSALLNGEWAEEYPYVTLAYQDVVGGRASPAVVEFIKGLGEPPWSDGKLRAANRFLARFYTSGTGGASRVESRRRAQEARRRPRKNIDLPEPKMELSTATQQALADAELTPNTDVDDMAALQRARRELNRMLEQDILTKEEYLQLTKDLGAIESAIDRINDERASAAKARKDAAAQAAKDRKDAIAAAKLNAHENRVFEIEQRVARAAGTPGFGDDIRRLQALRREHIRWRNEQKKGTAEWREAQADVDATTARIKVARTSAREQKGTVERWKLERRVRLAAETDGIKDDLRALNDLKRHLIAARNEHRKYSEQWMAYQTEIDETNATIRDVKQGAKEKAKNRAGLDSAFFQGMIREIMEQFAPNFWPASDGGAWVGGSTPRSSRPATAVTIEQTFPTAPTDYHREARWAVAAAQAVFDG